MDKTILELCRELPDSEAELRLPVNAEKFTDSIAMQVMGWRCSHTPEWYFDENTVLVPAFDPLNSIVDAKAATDAMRDLGCYGYMREVYDGRQHLIRWRIYFPNGRVINLERYVEIAASTEELARAACALLAADAVKVKN